MYQLVCELMYIFKIRTIKPKTLGKITDLKHTENHELKEKQIKTRQVLDLFQGWLATKKYSYLRPPPPPNESIDQYGGCPNNGLEQAGKGGGGVSKKSCVYSCNAVAGKVL